MLIELQRVIVVKWQVLCYNLERCADRIKVVRVLSSNLGSE